MSSTSYGPRWGPRSTDVILRLREAITSGALRPDAHLQPTELSQQLGTSRRPIRDALLELEREGLVKTDEKGRARISTLSLGDLVELSLLRVMAENMGASWAAGNWTSEHSAAVQNSIVSQGEATTLQELCILDVEMHDYILAASGHRRLRAIWKDARPQFEMWLSQIFELPEHDFAERKRAAIHSHLRLLMMLMKGSKDGVERTMTFHVRTWQELLMVNGEPILKKS